MLHNCTYLCVFMVSVFEGIVQIRVFVRGAVGMLS